MVAGAVAFGASEPGLRSSFTNKLEGMFKDIDLSRDIMATFRQSARSMARIGDTELNVSVSPNPRRAAAAPPGAT